jgi:hypothetical protein
VKNQYFGDNRDLFNYDLVLQIIKEGLVSHFTFIPMLTPAEPTSRNTKREGEQRNRSKAKAGWNNRDLIEFLNRFNNKSERDIRHLDVWFKKQRIKIETFRDYFYNAERVKYFQEARGRLLPKSVICVDPDIGLEFEVEKPKEKHILYSEVTDLYKQMDSGSLLMIFQFIPRKKRETYFPRICGELKQEVGNLPIYISDNQIVFFFLAKDKSLRKLLSNILSDYKGSYPKLRIGNAK